MPTAPSPDTLELAATLTAGILAGGALSHLPPDQIPREAVRLMNQVRAELRQKQVLGTLSDPREPSRPA